MAVPLSAVLSWGSAAVLGAAWLGLAAVLWRRPALRVLAFASAGAALAAFAVPLGSPLLLLPAILGTLFALTRLEPDAPSPRGADPRELEMLRGRLRRLESALGDSAPGGEGPQLIGVAGAVGPDLVRAVPDLSSAASALEELPHAVLLVPARVAEASLSAMRGRPGGALAPLLFVGDASSVPKTLLDGALVDVVAPDASELELRFRARRLAEEAQLRRAALEAAELVGRATHELRTPLTTLHMNLQLLERELAAGSNERVEKARRATRQLVELVDALAELSRIERGQVELEPAALELRALAAEVVAAAEPRAKAKRSSLALAPGAALPLRSDARLLKLVLTQLLARGIQLGEGASVTVRVEPAEAGATLAVEVDRPGAPADGGGAAWPLERTVVTRIVGALSGKVLRWSESPRSSRFAVTVSGVADEGSGREAL